MTWFMRLLPLTWRARLFAMGRNKKDEKKKELCEERHELRTEERLILRELKRIADSLELLNAKLFRAESLALTQRGEKNMGVITGIAPGATEIFDLSPLPVGSSLKAGSVPTFVSDNSTDVSPLTVDPTGLFFAATGAATFTATSFNVTVSAVSSDDTPLTKTFNIPLNGPIVPPPVPAIDLDLTQRPH